MFRLTRHGGLVLSVRRKGPSPARRFKTAGMRRLEDHTPKPEYIGKDECSAVPILFFSTCSGTGNHQRRKLLIRAIHIEATRDQRSPSQQGCLSRLCFVWKVSTDLEMPHLVAVTTDHPYVRPHEEQIFGRLVELDTNDVLSVIVFLEAVELIIGWWDFNSHRISDAV